VNPVLAASAVAGLGMLAAAGVVAGLTRRDPAPLEPPDDPLEDGRLALNRSLADLEDAHAVGALEEDEYVRLREATDARIARVVRALERREHASTPVRVASKPGTADGASSEPRRVPPWAVATLIAGVVLATVVAALVRDAEPTPGQASAPPESAEDPLASFERRVRDHPDDLAARLDLAHRYLDAQMIEEALAEYAVALELDPDDAEALAHVGYILFIGERPHEALASVDRALETDPTYPEALFFRGVILLEGLDRPGEAVEAFEAYLDSAPFGVQRGQAEELIEQAREAAAST
jgi:cytochrome c-type biogenesis protein CcmH/NrfG